MYDVTLPAYWEPRNCLREPIAAIFEAARLLDMAVTAHIADDKPTAARLIQQADIPEIREWIESLWGSRADNAQQPHYHRIRPLEKLVEKIPKDARPGVRMPSSNDRRRLFELYGWNCSYCAIPLIDSRVRTKLQISYPIELRWGPRNVDRHSAFQCMTPEIEHVVPHCYGGSSDMDNTMIACGPCNCGKADRLLEHHGLNDPRERVFAKSTWDGLTRLFNQ